MKKTLKIGLILAILTAFFLVLIVEAIQITKFTNDLSTENLTFDGDENIIRYVEIPRYTNVISGYLNLTGHANENWIGSIHVANPDFEVSSSWTYYETDVDFTGDYSTAWKTQGSKSYKLEKPADAGCDLYFSDGDFANIYQQLDFTDVDKLRFDYKFQGSGTAWEAVACVGAGNYCDAAADKWRITTTGTGNVEIDVSDRSGNQYFVFELHHANGEECYTAEMHLYIDDIEEAVNFYPANPYLEIGTPDASYEWEYEGTFSSTEKTSDFSSVLDTALNSGACDCTGCSLDGGNCIIPFLFNQNTLGTVKLEYSAIDINYATYPSVNLSSPDNNTWSSGIKTFNCSATDEIQLSNITFYFWNSTGDLNLSTTKSLTGTSNSTTYEMTFGATDTFSWNCKAINNNSYSSWADNNFTINVDFDNPVITLDSPIGNINTANVQFNYTPEHSTQTVDTCELWGDFTGTWALNQTNSSITEEVINSFNQTLSEDIIYKWNIRCNTTETGNSAFAPFNFTFTLDLTTPNLTISQPIGTKSSKTVFYEVSASDNFEMNTCIYWVMKGASADVANTTISCDSTMIGSFGVSSDLTSYVFHFFVSDGAGNSNSSSSAFDVDTTAIAGGGAKEEEEEEIIEVSICVPFKTLFFQGWEKAKEEENILGKIKILWNSWWNYIICSSAASIIPI